MRIPPAYQTQALNFPPPASREAGNSQAEEQETSSVSVRLGKFGLTYSTQDTQPEDSSPRAGTFSRPAASFAQEFSFALARQTRPDSSLSSQSYQPSQPSSPLVQAQAFQAYSMQADYQAAVSTPTFSAMA
ncbi:hypothetical protein [Desulfoplanes sp.]